LERLEVNAPVETRSIVPRSVDMRKSLRTTVGVGPHRS
jgi:hypothetical protein